MANLNLPARVFQLPCQIRLLTKNFEANPAGQSSSFIFTVCVKSVPHYHFRLAYVVPHMAVKEFFETHFSEWRYRVF